MGAIRWLLICIYVYSSLLEMLPIYQLRLNILGVYGSAQGKAIAVHTPVLNGTPVNTLQM
jgi:hypothetical protein